MQIVADATEVREGGVIGDRKIIPHEETQGARWVSEIEFHERVLVVCTWFEIELNILPVERGARDVGVQAKRRSKSEVTGFLPCSGAGELGLRD